MNHRICMIALAACAASFATHAADAPQTPASAAQAAPAASLQARLTASVNGSKVPAMGAVVIRHGQVMELAVAGLRAKGGAEAVQRGDVWHLGSNGKAMTATMVARLVEKGVLSWDAPLGQLLPELAADMQAAYRDVTLRDLLAHQAGLQGDIDESWMAVFYKDKRALHEQRLAFARIALAQAPAYARGAGDGYSNSGVLIAGLAAERATGLPYEALMQRELFEPLGLRSAGFGATHRGQPLGHKAGEPVEGVEADNPAVIAPAGGITLSLEDWARFAIDQMAGEQGRGKLLKAETYRLLHQPAREGGKFALGWRAQNSMAGVNARHLAHTGSNGAWFALIVLKPDTEDAVLVTGNASEDVEADKAVRAVAIATLKAMAP
ncbi:serine hydrolase domain-containing protein [Roseateles sp. NT4]|uniref:serine hydrolase domain-containing protein n=1 Tax=Roseateles sp. NT4 TaxID=3453715 RepID=UPI003EE8F051